MSVIWHDLECGAYRQDLPLWSALADEHGDPVLDIGAGTGRTALALAAAGHRVTALDIDAELLEELSLRARGLPLETVQADARSFALQRRFALCIVPMQTVQLLGGIAGRAAFLACARAHLVSGGALALALADVLETYEVADGALSPLPDMTERDGVVYASRPIAVRAERDGYVLERRRETVSADGRRSVQPNRVRLDRLGAGELERQGREAGFTPTVRTRIPPTTEHAGSVVVVLNA